MEDLLKFLIEMVLGVLKIRADWQKRTSTARQQSPVPSPPLSPAEAELQERRARIAYVQENWPTYK